MPSPKRKESTIRVESNTIERNEIMEYDLIDLNVNVNVPTPSK
jgi:hypothetical protein